VLGSRDSGFARRAGRPGDLRDHRRADLGRRADWPVAGRRCHVGGHSRVRRPHHLGAVLVQGGGRRRRRPGDRSQRVPDRARPGRTGGRPSRRPRPVAIDTGGRAPHRARPLRVSDQAEPARQRGRARHADIGARSAGVDGRGRLLARSLPGHRRRVDGRARRRTRLRGHRCAGVGRRRPLPPRAVPGLVRRPARPGPPGRRGALGRRARHRLGRERRGRPVLLFLRARLRQRRRGRATAAGVRGEPGGRLPLARSRPDAPLPRLLPVARGGVRGPCGRPRRQARDARMAAGQGGRVVVGVLPRRRVGQSPARLPVRRQRPGRGDPGEAAHPRRGGRPPGPAAHPGRLLRRRGQAGGAARPARPAARARPVQAADDPGPGVGRAGPGRDPPRPRPGRAGRRRRLPRPGVRRRPRRRGRLSVRAEGRPDPRRPARAGAATDRPGRARHGRRDHPASPGRRGVVARRDGRWARPR
jgi:hypothetical protein